jgi:type II secretory pathway component PulJ
MKVRRSSGFTLIELLLAAAAAALILGVLVHVYSDAIRLRRAAGEHTRAARLEARAINFIRSDLRNARLSGGKMAVTLDTGDTATHSQFPGGLRFNTTTGRINEDEFGPELQQVEYYISADAESGEQKYGVLKRAINRTLLGTLTDPEGEETMLKGVESMEVGFFDGSQWQDSWDTSSSTTSSASSSSSTSTSGPATPLAIRVRLMLAPDARPGSNRRMIEVLVPWTMQANAAPPNLPAPDPADGSGTGTGTGSGTGGAAK